MKQKILVVDDDLATLEVTKLILEDLGYEVLKASDGLQAWEVMSKEPVWGVVSDWVMPGMDGLALCKKIRETMKPSAYIYFMMLTGEMTAHQNYLTAMDQGVDDFLVKPLSRQLISIRLRVAERMLGLRQQVIQLEGVIPICTYCKRIRRDDQVYEQMEAYIQKNSLAVFSHGICPECLEKNFPAKPGEEA